MIAFLFLGASVIAGVLLIIGSWFHRMVGVEAVNALQVIYYLHYTIDPYNPSIKNIQYMSAVGWNNLFLKNTKQNFEISPFFMRVIFSMSQTETTLLIFAIVLTFIGFLALIFFLLSVFAEPTRKTSLLQKLKFIQTNLLFPLSLAMLIPSFLIISSFSSHSHPEPVLFNESIRCPLILITIGLVSFSFCQEICLWIGGKRSLEYQ